MILPPAYDNATRTLKQGTILRRSHDIVITKYLIKLLVTTKRYLNMLALVRRSFTIDQGLGSAQRFLFRHAGIQ